LTLNLLSVGHFHPENEITNQFLEDLDIGTSHEWIMERVGIRSRRTSMSLDYIRETRNVDVRAANGEGAVYSTSQLAASAAEMALERAGLQASDIGLVVNGSCAADSASPADACRVGGHLGIDSPCIDVNSACTSFLAGMWTISMMDPAKLPDYVLLTTGDCMTKTVNYNDRSSAVLWGDAGLAAVLSTRHLGRAQILGNAIHSDPGGADKVVVPRLGHFDQDGRTVQMFAIKKTGLLLNELKESFGDDSRRMNFIGHQANLRMLETVCTRCDIAPDRHYSNCEFFGNTGAASSGSVLSQNWEKFTGDDDVAIVGVGSGLTWASYLVRFGDRA